MKTTRFGFLFLFLAALPGWAGLRVGCGKASITPPEGMPMGGGYSVEIRSGVEDDLYCKALAFEESGTKAVLVSCDIMGLPTRFVQAARRIIASETGIPGENVMVSATHTHTGPEMLDLSLEGVTGKTLEIVRQYQNDIPKRIAEAVRRAVSDLQPARIRAAIGREPSLPFNRRFLMKDGTVVFNPGKLNPDVVRPAGPVDPDVPVILFESPTGRPLAVFWNYAMHVAVGGPKFSADYPGVVARRLAEALDPDLMTVFSSGAAGNINHWDVNIADRQTGPREAARIGTVLAAEILRTIKKLEPVNPSPLRVRSQILKLPLAAPRAGELPLARSVMERAAKGENVSFLEVVHAFQVVGTAKYDGFIPAEVQVISVGDQVAWAGMPGEIFVEFGMALKNASPFRFTILSELTNDDILNSYVPNRKAYREGAYEVINALCGEGAGEMMLESATKLLFEAHAGLPGTTYTGPPVLKPGAK